MSSRLAVRALTKRFTNHLRGGRTSTVLDAADFDMEPGSFVAVTGPSGSGKSSLLRCVFRTYLPDGGSIVLTDEEGELDLAAASDRDVLDCRRRRMGLAAQFLHVIPRVPAVDLVAAEGLSRAEAADQLRRLGLDAVRVGDSPGTFSGGERQIVGLAIALARRPPLLLLDEPTASLDPLRRKMALSELQARKDQGTTILGVFHDVPETTGLIDCVVRVQGGQVVPA